jgi:hypothetical protein
MKEQPIILLKHIKNKLCSKSIVLQLCHYAGKINLHRLKTPQDCQPYWYRNNVMLCKI